MGGVLVCASHPATHLNPLTHSRTCKHDGRWIPPCHGQRLGTSCRQRLADIACAPCPIASVPLSPKPVPAPGPGARGADAPPPLSPLLQPPRPRARSCPPTPASTSTRPTWACRPPAVLSPPPSSAPAQVTRSFVSLDPRFHVDPPDVGTVLVDAAIAISGTLAIGGLGGF
jgi:hypothetical protein